MNRPPLNRFRIRDFSSSLGSALNASTQAQESNQDKSFRLLCLDDLTLQPFDIGSSPPYIAISHTWAERLFDDIPRFDSSLGGRAIRKAVSETFPAVNYCWVDNFCILQDNENDKFEQIPLMGNIYRDADAVLIIHAYELGLTQDELDQALEGVEGALELRRLRTPFTDVRWRYWKKGDGYTKIVRAANALAKFAQSDWSSRVWTLQEFIFACTIVWIGAELIPVTCEESFFWSIPTLYLHLGLQEASEDSGIRQLRDKFPGMADMRLPGHEPTRIMEVASFRKASLPIDKIYGAMAVSGVQIEPLHNETEEEAWFRWCEAAVARGHIRWLMLPPVAPFVLSDVTQGSCLFPPASKRGLASSRARLGTVVPYGPPSISAGTVRLTAKFAGRCRILRRLGSMLAEPFYPMLSLILFSKGDWFLAVHIAESFCSGQFSRNELHAIAQVLVDNYESVLLFCREGKPAQSPPPPLFSSPLGEKVFATFDSDVAFTIAPLFRDAVAYLALLESEALKLSLPVALALSDRVPTGHLTAFDFNAITYEKRSILLIVEAENEDVQRMYHDPDFHLEDFIHHKAGITSPVAAHFGGTPVSINIGGSRCPVCQTIDKVV
jgi:hypothetical protein